MSDLECISRHIYDKISSIQRLLDLSDVPQDKIKTLGQEIISLEILLEEFETTVGCQKDQLNQLKELEELFQNHVEILQHLKDNVPAHMPKEKAPEIEKEPSPNQDQVPNVEPIHHNIAKNIKCYVREMEFITTAEFESIPQYMKGRVSYSQINAAVQSINTAIAAKYKIIHQPVKTLKNHARKLLQRFKDQETKETKGQYFVVEEDLREFTQMKVDKRLQGIFNMLRHCQRLREQRGGRVTRYVLL
uniref:spindle and kinetochore-associated protein 1 n=1 Tax=Doryrhamphus excisus TaxID=161450 RepID=UPI0025AE5F1C|nr:spindle and kinetochore-associated protein 1 [Doryrhamphus excisus]XP_057943913.1 spindle and kinetochore-associated protein 1 [Doryrhamphus excisus]XP_057943914.1 spindle and kinetochore-associated protein 1 [Doryrhamphus excisus]